MTDTPPTPPEGLPEAVIEALEGSSPALLRRTAEYATDLAEYRERRTADNRSEGTDREGDDAGDSEDRPEGVPPKATVTVKEINDNRYYYWQWRDGERVRSKYKGPVTPDE